MLWLLFVSAPVAHETLKNNKAANCISLITITLRVKTAEEDDPAGLPLTMHG
jgi:hypothetical protein